MTRKVTLAFVLVTGVAIALVIASLQRGSDRREAILEGIVDPDASIRAEAWKLMGPEPGRSVVIERLLEHRGRAAVLAEAAVEFDRRDWTNDAILVTAAARLGDHLPLITHLDRGDLGDADSRRELLAGIAAVVVGGNPTLGERMIEACLGWLSPSEREMLLEALIMAGATSPEIDRPLLAMALMGTPPPSGSPDSPVTVLARCIATEKAPRTAEEIRLLPAWTLGIPSLDSFGRSELQRRMNEDDAEARRTLGTLDRDRLMANAETVAADRGAGFERRAISAARLVEQGRTPGDAALLNLLATGPGDADGTVHASVVIARGGLSETARQRLSGRWLRSTDGTELRAGLLLAAMRHRDGELATDDPVRLEIDRLARDPETPPRVRRTARLVARATDRWPFDPSDLDADAYANRTRRLEDGRYDPDGVLLGLVSGDPEAARLLVSRPEIPAADAATFAREIAWRRVLAGVFHPDWIDAVGEPVPGDEDALRLWIDLLSATRSTDPFAEPAPSDEDLRR